MPCSNDDTDKARMTRNNRQSVCALCPMFYESKQLRRGRNKRNLKNDR